MEDDLGQAVYHDGMVYYPFGSAVLTAETGKATGNWRRIASVYDEEPVEKEVFRLWINHGISPQSASYGYMVFPSATKDDWQQQMKQSGIEPLCLTEKAHVVRFKNIIQSVFFEPFSFQIPDGETLCADRPCIVMMERDGDRRMLSVCDPTQKEKEIILRISGKWQGDYCRYSETDKQTVITLPVEHREGESVLLPVERSR
jgi:chondroitin AC lyase